MRLLSVNLPDDHNIFHFGDKHDGNPLTSDSGWDELVSMMNQPYDGCSNNFGIDGGDMMDLITTHDKRYRPELDGSTKPLKQINVAVKKREPIKRKMLTALQGNHDDALSHVGAFAEDVCERLGIPFGTYTVKLTIKDRNGDLMYKIYETHGHKGITSAADDPQRRLTNMNLSLKRQLLSQAGDCAVMVKHHVHKLLVTKPISVLYLTDDGEKITQHYTHSGQAEQYIHPDSRWYGCAGSFLRLFGDGISGYGERAEYPPTELGFLILKVRDRKIVALEPYYIGL